MDPSPRPPTRALAERLLARTEEVLADYLSRLDDVDSVLVHSPAATAQLVDQARSILHEVCAGLAARDASPDVPGLALSSQIGVSRATDRVHPIESLVAADRLFRTVLTAGGECGTELGLGPESITELGTILSEVLFRRLGEACAAYASLLLDEVRLANEHERRRIARELHDRVSYGLNAGFRQLELAELAVTEDLAQTQQRLSAANSLISGTIETTRNLAVGLHAGTPTAALGEALTAYGRSLDSDITTAVEVYGQDSWLVGIVREETYLIVREAMRNAIVHSGAAHLLVRIDIAPRELRAVVEDDGSGFATEQPGGDGLGLQSMRERAALISGSVRVQSRPGVGTRVELVVYLPRLADAEADVDKRGGHRSNA
ncbi:sensor histidine kinase [Microlunatus ginsengisoli]|uniref:histidine kinase n=1 Tax=Microlunatus ginsengisoli TaxID=363863 RepID=A0ABP7AH89_9ACTN